MSQSKADAHREDTSVEHAQTPDSLARRTKTWWAIVLAGLVEEPHPVHGADIDVTFKGGVLRISGELATEEDRQRLLNEAGEYVGRGIDAIDAKHLAVSEQKEKAGILDQTLLAAFADSEVAEFARRYLVDSRGIKAKQVEILDAAQEDKARRLVPDGFMSDIHKAFKAGDAILLLRVDETEAFRARELLAQETRSLWTISTPPTQAKPEGA
jgi:hypothetical protein